MNTTSTIDYGAGTLARAIQPAEDNLPIEAARSILHFRLSPKDYDRVNELVAHLTR